MSRGGRGGGRGGFGGNNPPPMGLTFQDIQALNREEDALYPVCALSVSRILFAAFLMSACSIMNVILAYGEHTHIECAYCGGTTCL